MMSDLVLVSTRKGLFPITRNAAGWHIGTPHFLGDNVTLSLVDPRDGAWYAALNLGHFGVKLKRSDDAGATWQEIAVPRYADSDQLHTGDGKPPQVAALKLIWSLESGGADEPGRLWAGTIPGGLFCSDDRGASWRLVRSLWDQPARSKWFGGGFDAPGIHSICVDPRDPRSVRVAISCGGVWTTHDGGDSWINTSAGMRAEYMPPEGSDDPDVQDPHRMVQCQGTPDAFWIQHHNGVFRSLDGACSWTEVNDVAVAKFGFAVAVHPRDADTAWLIPAIKDERRVPVGGRLVVTRTRDGGRSFDVLREGLPQVHAYDLVYRHALAIDASGERLVFASTTGGLWLSEDQGEHWQTLSTSLPPVAAVRFG
jgi:hypothetical protein